MIKIATWNVNSVKSRIEHLLEVLRNENAPDILLLQELKCEDAAFPLTEIEDAGYNAAIYGQKTYNGVAVLSKFPIDEIIKGFNGMPLPPNSGGRAGDLFSSNQQDARYIECVISLKNSAIRVASVYVPNGQEPGSEKFLYKLTFFDALYNHIKSLLKYDEILIIGGDYNVAPEPIDVFDPKSLDGTTCYHLEERKRFRALLGLGMVDVYRAINLHTQGFSWWDYRAGAWQHNKGMRIDHLLLSPQAADLAVSSDIDLKPRGKEKPSDHTIVWCGLR